MPQYVSLNRKRFVKDLRCLNDDKNDRGDAVSTREKRLQLRCKKKKRKREMTWKKIWLNNLKRLSRDFFFVKRRRDVGGRCKSGPCFDGHLVAHTVDACCFGLIFFVISFLAIRLSYRGHMLKIVKKYKMYIKYFNTVCLRFIII